MKTQIKEINSFTRSMAVTVLWSDLEQQFNQEFKKFKSKIAMPGFRKGKVPIRLVESRYGKSIRESVIGDLLPSLMSEAAREAGLVPAATPKITKLEHEPGQPLSFTASMDIWPEVKVETVEGLKLT